MRKCSSATKQFLGKLLLVVIIITSFNSNLFGQGLTGTKTIGTEYSTLALAIADLNAQGVGTGGVTFNVPASYTETFASPTAGLISATGTAANPIVFQKSGGGADPVITAGTGTGTLDFIIVITGGDYITIDGIDLSENSSNTTATTQMEAGYALLKRNSTAPFDGCQNVTIKNCTITLNKANTSSFGIYCNNHTTASTTALTITATTDAMNNCKFYNNTVSNVNFGIYLLGFLAANPYTLYDQNNEIGVSGGNSVTYWGSTVAAYGIYAAYQNGIKVDNNIVSNATGTTNTIYGICIGTSTSSNVEIVGNDVSVKSSATTFSLAGIWNAGGGTPLVSSNTVTIANNNIHDCTFSTATTGSFIGIWSSTSPSLANIYGNSVINNTRAGTTGTFYSLEITGGTTLNCNSNIIHDNSVTSGSAIIYGIYVSGSSLISENYHDNTINNITTSGTGAVYGMFISTSNGTKSTYNNNIHTLSSTSGAVYGYGNGTNAGVLNNFYKNQIYDLTATASAGTVYGASLFPTTLNMYNNYIYNLKAPAATGTNAINGIYISGGTNANVYYNTVYMNATSSSITTFGTTGIYANTTPILDLRNNIIVNTSTPVGAAYTAAYRRSSTTISTHAATSNNNDFFAGTPGSNYLIFHDGTNSDITIGAYKSRVASSEASSFTELPNFVTVANNSCRINTSIATQLEGTGAPVTTPIAITDDYFSNVRNATTPDVGAEEFAGIPYRTASITALIEGFYNGTTMISDTITVELRNNTTPYTLVESEKIALNNLGTGSGNFPSTLNGTPYYIVVKHRNAVETWSATTQSFSSGSLSYDFTSVQTQAYGSNMKYKGSKWCIYSGDCNHDGIVDSGDLGVVDNDNANYISGYVNTDVNGDGIVDSGDLGLVDNNNAAYVSKVVPSGAPSVIRVIRPVKLNVQE